MKRLLYKLTLWVAQTTGLIALFSLPMLILNIGDRIITGNLFLWGIFISLITHCILISIDEWQD